MAVVIIWTDDPVAAPGPDLFAQAVKRPAGVVAPDPEFTLYLGTNTGPYKKADNGTVILPPIPIEWIIAPQNVTVGQCPSRTDNLQLFGITNAIFLTLALVMGCRPLLRYTTRGLLGKPSRYSWIWTWIISCSLQVASNAIVSHLVVTTPGYEHLSMLNVFALYSSRPRINQLWMAILRLVVGPIYYSGRLAFLLPTTKKKPSPSQTQGTAVLTHLRRYLSFFRPTTKVETPPTQTQGNAVPLKPAAGLRYQYDEYVNWHSKPAAQEIQVTEPVDEFEPDGPEWVYTDSYVTTCIAELTLHLISAIFIGVTWRRFPNAPIREYMTTDVNLMIAAPALALVSWVCVPIWLRRDRGVLEDLDPCRRICTYIFMLLIPAIFTYGVAWKYWADFLLLPGSLWCPPKVITLAAVWSSLSALSAAIGALL